MKIKGTFLTSKVLNTCPTQVLKQAYFLLVILIACFPEAVSANDKEKTEDLAELQMRIKTLTRQINNAGEQKHSIIMQLAVMEKQYGKLIKTINELTQKSVEKQRLIVEVSEKIIQQQEAISKHNKALQGQIRAAYAMKGSDAARLLMNQQDPVLTSRMLVYYGYFNKARLQKLQLYSQDLQFLNDLKSQKVYESEGLQKVLAVKQHEQKALQIKKKNVKNYCLG